MSDENQEVKPCGCIITKMEDGTTQIGPCIPCGIMEVARAMGSVGQLLAAVATRIKHERDNQTSE